MVGCLESVRSGQSPEDERFLGGSRSEVLVSGWSVCLSMASMEGGKGAGLVGLSPELSCMVALGGDLGFEDVKALAQTCRRMTMDGISFTR